MAAGRELTAAEWVASGSHLATPGGRVFYRAQGTGAALVMLHGFPTWSYDWSQVVPTLARDRTVVTLDFPGYGMSEKRKGVDFGVAAAADSVEQVLRHLAISRAELVVHDFGAIVGQEMLDRRRSGRLSFDVEAVNVLNCGIVYSAYRPTSGQKLLAMPMIGALVARRLTRAKLHAGINAIRGVSKLSDAEFDELWSGMSKDEGHKFAHRQIRYNAERAVHHERWEDALFGYDGRLRLIWGLADPVSGRHVLDAARARLPTASITALEEVGHFPQSEAPEQLIAALLGRTPNATGAAA